MRVSPSGCCWWRCAPRTSPSRPGCPACRSSSAYLVAATGPFVYGLVHDAAGGWVWPVGVGLVVLIPMLVFGVLAGRDRLVGGG